MKTNFEIEDNYAINYNGIHIDLHNNFDFVGLTDLDGQNLTLQFLKSKGEWVHENEFEQLVFRFKNVNYKYFEEGEPGDYPEDAKCLGEISFFPSEVREINNSIIPQERPKTDDDIIFFFEDGRVIRLNADLVELEVKK